MITADHKVLNQGGESRNSHRKAVVVQDVATQWIQSYPCKTKTSQETEWSSRKFLEPSEKPKVIYTDNALEFGKSCEDVSWNRCTPTPHRSETNGVVERAVRRIKEGTSAVLLQSGLDETWWADSVERCCYLQKCPRPPLADGRTPHERRFGEPFKGPAIPCGSMVEYHPFSAKDQSRLHQFGKEVLLVIFLGYASFARNLERRHFWLQTLRNWEIWTRQKSMLEGSMQRKLSRRKKVNILHIPNRSWNRNLLGRDDGVRESTPTRDQLVGSEDLRGDLQGNSEKSQPIDETKDDAEACNELWSIEWDFIYRCHVEPRVQLGAPKEETFPRPLKYIDVTRTTHTNLDALQECRIDD